MSGTETHRPKVAYLFPGQGSHTVGMGLELYSRSPAARQVFQEVDSALGIHLSRLMFEGPEQELRQTINSQPAIMTLSLAYLQAMEEALGPQNIVKPTLLAGHSLGEYTALTVAGVLDRMEAVWLVRERGRLMQSASLRRPGGMVAIMGLDEVTLEEVCLETGAHIANVNTDTQFVISGDRLCLARAIDLAVARGAKKAVSLAVSGAFHSSLMESAREGLSEAMGKVHFRAPAIPIVANTTGKPVTTVEQIKEEALAQLCSCVRWRESVSYMVNSGVNSFVEVGPGKVLSGLVRHISRRVRTVSVGDLEALQHLTN
ncbi:MAG: ACP S-malonyltransferase [Dehalococcoidia bacterium]